MSDPKYTEADLAPERQLQHIKNLQRQVETLFNMQLRESERRRLLTERVEQLEAEKKQGVHA